MDGVLLALVLIGTMLSHGFNCLKVKNFISDFIKGTEMFKIHHFLDKILNAASHSTNKT